MEYTRKEGDSSSYRFTHETEICLEENNWIRNLGVKFQVSELMCEQSPLKHMGLWMASIVELQATKLWGMNGAYKQCYWITYKGIFSDILVDHQPNLPPGRDNTLTEIHTEQYGLCQEHWSPPLPSPPFPSLTFHTESSHKEQTFPHKLPEGVCLSCQLLSGGDYRNPARTWCCLTMVLREILRGTNYRGVASKMYNKDKKNHQTHWPPQRIYTLAISIRAPLQP